jgi:hypothetical protein
VERRSPPKREVESGNHSRAWSLCSLSSRDIIALFFSCFPS